MKKLLVIIFSICLISGCGNNRSNKEENTPKNTTTTNSSTTTISSTNSSTTEKVSTNTTTISSALTTKAKTTKKITTVSTKVTKVNITTKKTTTSTKIKLTENEVRNRILALKKKYPDGTSWTNENRTYNFKASNMTNYVGHGCVAFAFMASDAAFGDLPVKKLTTFDVIRTGDIIRYLDDSHSVIVLDVKEDKVIVAEGNIRYTEDQDGVILWGRSIDISEIKESGTYIYTRWT